MNSKRTAIICGMMVLMVCSVSAGGLKRRAEQGDARAQYELGKHYSERKNYNRALPWLRKAAEQGHPAAQNRLGVMYERGQGVPMDIVEAFKWYSLAADAGNTFAAANCASLEHRFQGKGLARVSPLK